MHFISQKLSLLLLAFIGLVACSHQPPSLPKYEFRAVWIATFHNIDWPSKKGLNSAIQRNEFREILDKQKQNNMNAVVVQVRPCGDAMYASEHEPWSEFLSGKQGKAPVPNYDAMEFMVEEAHQRNMEFHAWMNPFRGVSHVRFSQVSKENVWKKHPEWFFQYGNTRYFNPGLPEVRNHVAGVVADLVRRYDIDGIHFDDYFYPYPVGGEKINDWDSYNQYGKGFLTLNEWRRNNINLFVKQIADSIQHIKPYVKFGISPSAVWRNQAQDPEGSKTTLPNSSYDDLHADVRHWLKENWIDYVAPQCYYGETYSKAPYQNLLDWWQENTYGRHLYIGQAMYKVKEGKYEHWRNPKQLPRQLMLNRKREKVHGSIFFSASSFDENPRSIDDELKYNLYRRPALIPAMSWKDTLPPNVPQMIFSTTEGNSRVTIQWQAPVQATDGETATYYVVYCFLDDEETNLDDPRNIKAILRENKFVDKRVVPGTTYRYVITAVDRLHNESRESLSMEVAIPE